MRSARGSGFYIAAEKVVLKEKILDRRYLRICNGIITAIDDSPADDNVIDFRDNYLSPGYIDIHTHGIAGHGSLDPSAESLLKMKRIYSRFGVTSFLPTFMTASAKEWEKSLKLISGIMHQDTPGARIIGVNLEGPFLDPKMHGAHNIKYVRGSDLRFVQRLINTFPAAIKIITLAPELANISPIIKYLSKNDIVVSLGHTSSSSKHACEAVNNGARLVTHLFNSMSRMHHRDTSISTYSLVDNRLFVEIIADNIHIHPDVLKIVLLAKSPKRIVLVSDSIRETGLGDGVYSAANGDIEMISDKAYLDKESNVPLSTLSMDVAVRNMVKLGCSIPSAVRMASFNPAKILNIDSCTGSIAEGKKADITVFDESFQIIATMTDGRFQYYNKKRAPTENHPTLSDV